jgi:AcrR family transcriptional regulator
MRKPKPTRRAAGKRGAHNEFIPSRSQREQVEILAATRVTEEDIARTLGIAKNTLRKHFADELATGHAKRTSEMIMAMYRSGVGGNVAAQKAWLQRVELSPPPKRDAKTKTKALGKKEIANLEAEAAPDDKEWAQLIH